MALSGTAPRDATCGQRAAGGLPFVCIHLAVAVKGYWQKASGSLLGGLVSVSKMLKSM